MGCDVVVDGWPCGRTDPHDEADVHSRPGNVYTEPYWSTIVEPWQRAGRALRADRMTSLADLRAARNLASGVDPAEIGSLGFLERA